MHACRVWNVCLHVMACGEKGAAQQAHSRRTSARVCARRAGGGARGRPCQRKPRTRVVSKSKHAAHSSRRATRGAAAVQPWPPLRDPCCSSSSFYPSLSPLSPSLSRSRSRSARAHSLAGNTQHSSDCALFLSLARPRSFTRARAHSLSLFLFLSLSTHTHILSSTSS